MSDIQADLSMACSPEIWELKLFLWTSADWPAWNDVLLELDAQKTPIKSLENPVLNS
jgi:hypothetical protein